LAAQREYGTRGLADDMLRRRTEEQQIRDAASVNPDHDEVAFRF
jgi:hypothetical protein